MGVTHLWQILDPVKQHVPLHSLKGKTLAVDLSLWVCEAQTVKKMVGIVTKPHLRNLFFRVSSLTLMGIYLVFVMEGEPPKLKATTVQKRIDARFGPSEKPRSKRIKRSRFKCLLKECLEMLDCLGVPWVQAAGEAEATCAYLNANGYVDGCITNDGDAFLYGAQTVYRNFTMNAKDPHVDCYTMSAIEEKLGCSRESLIGLAILLGCDYLPKGVPGVGKEQALKLIRTLRGQSLLQRFDLWKEHVQYGNTSGVPAKNMPHCLVCHHPGDYKDHGRLGCRFCGSLGSCEPQAAGYLCPCEWHSLEQDRKTSIIEESIRKKAKACEGFPFPEVIQEYRIIKDKPMKLNEYQRPCLLSFQRFASKKMDWTKEYACEKLCVLLTHYDMNRRKSGYISPQQLQALRIVRTRVKNGIPCFEIEWKKPDDYASADGQPEEPLLITTEESSLFQAAYPEIVALYQMERLENGKGKKKGKRNKLTETECNSEVADLLSRLNIQSAVETIPRKDSRPSVETVASFQIFTKEATTQDLPGTARVSTEVIQSHHLPSASFKTGSQDTECEFSPLGFLSKQGEFTEESTKYSVCSFSLHLSGIDWEGTSFSISPLPDNVSHSSAAESVVCINSTAQHSPLSSKTAEIVLPCSDSLQYDPTSPSSVDLSDLSKVKCDLFLKEDALAKSSVTKAFPKVPNISPLNTLQTVEHLKETSQPENPGFSGLVQLNDSTQETANLLLEKYSRGSDLPHCKTMLKCSEDSAQIAKDPTGDRSLLVGLNTRMLKPVRLENKQPRLCLQSRKKQDKAQVRQNSIPNIPKTSFKRSVCQKSYSSDDSDAEAKKGTRGQRSPDWHGKCNMVHLKGRLRGRRNSSELAEFQVLNQKEPVIEVPGTDLSVNGPLEVHIHRPLGSIKSEIGGCYSHFQDSGSDSEVLVESPLPLSERLKLRLQSS